MSSNLCKGHDTRLASVSTNKLMSISPTAIGGRVKVGPSKNHISRGHSLGSSLVVHSHCKLSTRLGQLYHIHIMDLIRSVEIN